MKVRQEKTHAGCRMRREEEHPGRSRLLWAGLVLEAKQVPEGQPGLWQPPWCIPDVHWAGWVKEERVQPCGVTLLLGLPELSGRL